MAFALLLLLGLGLAGWMYRTAQADPVARRAQVPLPGLTQPLRVVLLSDIHVAKPDMPPERLARIVAQVNALRPDIVLIAGDFLGDGYLHTQVTPAEAIAPLRALRSRLGTYAVLGNHDHWNDPSAISAALRANGIRLLVNEAVQVGPLVLGGLNDDFTDRAEMARTVAAMEGLTGARLILSHSPDPFAEMPRDVPLMLAGHTHCGQISFPLVGALTYESDHGARYGCGEVSEDGRRLIVGGGLGTSVLPLRLGAVPELWLIELRPSTILPIADGEGDHP
ncbi:MAG TPA: metallophosphoesterase [Allosphingosinicella sp.]